MTKNRIFIQQVTFSRCLIHRVYFSVGVPHTEIIMKVIYSEIDKIHSLAVFIFLQELSHCLS